MIPRSGLDNERITGLKDLLDPVAFPDTELPFENVAQVVRLALIIRRTLKERRLARADQPALRYAARNEGSMSLVKAKNPL